MCSYKPVSNVIIEAIIIGVIFVILFAPILYLVKTYITLQQFDLLPTLLIESSFGGVVGFLFHIICEYSGLNVWYSKEYCKRISNKEKKNIN